MNDLEPFWGTYSRLQKQNSPTRLHERPGMGPEAGLDELLNIASSDDPGVLAIHAEKAVARGKARDRHRRHLRLRYLDPARSMTRSPAWMTERASAKRGSAPAKMSDGFCTA